MGERKNINNFQQPIITMARARRPLEKGQLDNIGQEQSVKASPRDSPPPRAPTTQIEQEEARIKEQEEQERLKKEREREEMRRMEAIQNEQIKQQKIREAQVDAEQKKLEKLREEQ